MNTKTESVNRRQFLVRAAGGTAAAAMLSRWGLMPASAAQSERFDFNLKATRIGKDTYAVIGELEHFNHQNGGNIVNVAFINTSDGVVLIDTGSNRRYGEQLKKLIRDTTGREVVRVYNTHFHPDHCLGNQLFERETLAALPKTISGLTANGDAFSDNLYRLLGDWMQGTNLIIPETEITFSSEKFGSHRLEMLPLAGHTDADLAILDHETGILFAGDLCFYHRAATTPHADLSKWHESLKQLTKTPHKRLLPGHGPADDTGRAIEETGAYLTWLEKELQQSVKSGEDMLEAADVEIPSQFRDIKVIREEFKRSIAHLYPGMEEELLPMVGQGQENL